MIPLSGSDRDSDELTEKFCSLLIVIMWPALAVKGEMCIGQRRYHDTTWVVQWLKDPR